MRFTSTPFTLAPPTIDCELTLVSHAKVLTVTKALHNALVNKEFTVNYLAMDPLLLQPLKLQALAYADAGELRLSFKDQGDHYVLSFNQLDTEIDFWIPPVIAWENFDIPRSELDRILREIPEASADFKYAHAFGTILDPTHRYRPYLQVRGLLNSDSFAQRLSVGFYASCNSSLAEKHRNSSIAVRTAQGWRCYIPVLEAQAAI